MSTEKYLTEAERLAEGATSGPWMARTTGRAGGDHWYVCDEGQSIASIHASDGEDEETRQPDADFIAAARTGWPQTVAALRAVLELHQPRQYRREGSRDTGIPEHVCEACHAQNWGAVAYPCATVQTINEHLEV